MNRSSIKIFVTSDLHFGHANIIKYCHRPFLSDYDKEALAKEGCWDDQGWVRGNSPRHRPSNEAVRLMDDTLIDNINAIVGENDILYHLGDFCFGVKSNIRHRAAEYRNRIKCRTIHNIWGNHDEPEIRDIFTRTYDRYTLKIDGHSFVLDHYAMAIWDGSHKGAIHLYGHSHAGAEEGLDRLMPGRRSMDVGVDNVARLFGKYRPIAIQEVLEIMKERPGHKIH